MANLLPQQQTQSFTPAQLAQQVADSNLSIADQLSYMQNQLAMFQTSVTLRNLVRKNQDADTSSTLTAFNSVISDLQNKLTPPAPATATS